MKPELNSIKGDNAGVARRRRKTPGSDAALSPEVRRSSHAGSRARSTVRRAPHLRARLARAHRALARAARRPRGRPGERVRGARADASAAGLPEVSEPEVVRHFVRLSQQNFAIDSQFYPLGSCTMKFNPKVNEWAARLPGFARLHPYAPEELMQGALELMARLEKALAEIVGMDAVSLQPAAGAQGELAGLMMIRAYHARAGALAEAGAHPRYRARDEPGIVHAERARRGPVPDGGADGIVHPEQIASLVDDDTAAIMITNPNTLGLFETHLPTIAKMVHEKGGLVYGDGANLNALMGRARPGDLGIDVMQFNLHKTFTTPHGGGGPGCGPVAFKRSLEPFQPRPTVRYCGRQATRSTTSDRRASGASGASSATSG